MPLIPVSKLSLRGHLRRNKYKKLFLQLFSIVLLSFLFFFSFLVGGNSVGAIENLRLDTGHELDEYKNYLPLVLLTRIKPKIEPSIFGAETLSGGEYYIHKADDANLFWLRYGVFNWNEIEPERTNPPTYHWESVDENGLLDASNRGLNVIAIIRYTPDWAQKIPGIACGPVAELRWMSLLNL